MLLLTDFLPDFGYMMYSSSTKVGIGKEFNFSKSRHSESCRVAIIKVVLGFPKTSQPRSNSADFKHIFR